MGGCFILSPLEQNSHSLRRRERERQSVCFLRILPAAETEKHPVSLLYAAGVWFIVRKYQLSSQKSTFFVHELKNPSSAGKRRE